MFPLYSYPTLRAWYSTYRARAKRAAAGQKIRAFNVNSRPALMRSVEHRAIREFVRSRGKTPFPAANPLSQEEWEASR